MPLASVDFENHADIAHTGTQLFAVKVDCGDGS